MKPSIRPWFMIIIRSLMFLTFQALISSIFFINGSRTPCDDSAAWWMITVSLTDLVCLASLVCFYDQENYRFFNFFRLDRDNLKRDLVFMLGFIAVASLISFFPNILSAKWLFGDIEIALDMLIRPLPAWAAITGFVSFPVLQGMVEIPLYTLYALPRLEKQGLKPWLAVTVISAFLSAQHIFVPFLPDARFIIYRLVMFLPFAVLIVITMRLRPRLMPYIAIMHMLMDMSAAVMFFKLIY